MSTWAWLGLFILAAAAVAIVHAVFHLRHFWRDQPMPTARDRDEDPTPTDGEVIVPPSRPLGDPRAVMSALPPQHSVNDVMHKRVQDQTIAQLAAQFDEMSDSPWVLGAISTDPAGWPSQQTPKTLVRAYAIALTLMMNPPAAKGSQTAVSGHGTLFYINVGNQRIAAHSSSECDELLKRVNETYLATVEPWRKELLGLIKTVASRDDVPRLSGMLYTVECGQTKVVVLDEAKQKGMHAILATAFKPFFEDERRRILDELIEATGA